MADGRGLFDQDPVAELEQREGTGHDEQNQNKDEDEKAAGAHERLA
jgi:hypothetical protein